MSDLLVFLCLLWLASVAVWLLAELGLRLMTVGGGGGRGDGA